MIVVGIESSHSPVLNGRDGSAVSRAKRAVATDEFLGQRRFVSIRHDQYSLSDRLGPAFCSPRSSRSNRSRRRTGCVPAVRAETLGLRLGSLLSRPTTVDWVCR